MSSRYCPSSLFLLLVSVALASAPQSALTQDPGSPPPQVRGTPPGGLSQPGAPGPGLPGLEPKLQITPVAPKRPADPSPILDPKRPGSGPTLPCPTDGHPRKVAVSLTPSQVRSGTPVKVRVSVECPLKETQRIDFSASSPGTTDRAAGETLAAFVNQIPRTLLQAGTSSVETSFTPRGLANSVNLNLTAATERPRVVSTPATVSITGDGGTSAPPAAPTTPPAAGCSPTVTLDAVQAAVAGGANVTVNLTLSCSPPGGAIVQIITQPAALLPGPPGGTVTIPAGQTRAQITLQAARQGSGTVTLRAVMSQPAGGASPTDTVSVN